MATIQELEQGIRMADQAGDAAAVQALGSELLRMQQAQPAPSSALAAMPIEDTNRLAQPIGNIGQQVAEAAAPVYRGAMPTLANMAAGAGIGFAMGGPPGALVGMGAAGLAEMVADPLVAGVNKLFGTRLSTPTEAWSHLMDKIGVPESSTEGQKLVEAITRGGMTALSGVGAGTILGQMANPVAKAIGSALASGPIEQVAAGAAAGGTGELARYGAQEAGFGETGQAVAGLVGGLAGGITAAKMAAPRTFGVPVPEIPGMTPASVQQTIAEAEAAARPVFTSDVARPKTWMGRRLQDISEGTFFGTGVAREAQQAARSQMIDDVLARFGAGADRELAADIAQNANAFKQGRIDYWSGVKNTLLDRISGNVPELQSPELSRTFTAISEEIDALNKINPETYRPIIDRLMGFGKGLLGQDIVDAAGNVVGKSGISLQAAEQNLKVVGEMLSKDPTLAHISKPLEKSAKAIYKALKEDIKNVIRKAEGAAVVSEYEVANAKLGEGIKQLESDALRSIFRKGNIKPEVVESALFNGKPSEMRLLYANLDNTGKAAARGAILSRVAKEATDKDGVISTARFASQLQKYNKQFGIFFNSDDKKAVDGLANYLRLTRRAEQYNVDPSTGSRMFMPVLGGYLGSTLGPVGAAAGASAFGGLAQAFESAPVRKLLTQLPRFKNNSDEQFSAVKRITEAVNASISNAEVERVRNKQLTFLPENLKAEQLGIGGVLTDTSTGYRMVSKDGKKFGLYGPDNNRIGIFSSQEDARKRAEKELRKQK